LFEIPATDDFFVTANKTYNNYMGVRWVYQRDDSKYTVFYKENLASVKPSGADGSLSCTYATRNLYFLTGMTKLKSCRSFATAF